MSDQTGTRIEELHGYLEKIEAIEGIKRQYPGAGEFTRELMARYVKHAAGSMP